MSNALDIGTQHLVICGAIGNNSNSQQFGGLIFNTF